MSAMMLAACKGHQDAVKVLLKNKANINAMNNEGSSALFCAAENGHGNMLLSLLGSGADINHKNMDDETALFAAITGGQANAVRLLLKHGADDSIVNKKGKNVYELAKSLRHKDILQLLEQQQRK
jgi:ankyrin repeat protein